MNSQHDDQLAALRAQMGSFDPMSFISDLVQTSLDKAAESQQLYAALGSAEGKASEGAVDIVVGPSGEVRSLTFVNEPSSEPVTNLSTAIMRAYRRAAAEANQVLAASSHPTVAGLIRDSVPSDVAAAREEAEDASFASQPAASGPAGSSDRSQRTIDDLPPDPELDRFLSLLDDPDPFRAIENMRNTPGVPRVDLNRSAEEIENEIRSEILAITQRGAAVEPELHQIRGVATSSIGEVVTDAWGGLQEVRFEASVRTMSSEALAEQLMALIAASVEVSAEQARALLTGSGVTTDDDPTVQMLHRRTERGQS